MSRVCPATVRLPDRAAPGLAATAKSTRKIPGRPSGSGPSLSSTAQGAVELAVNVHEGTLGVTSSSNGIRPLPAFEKSKGDVSNKKGFPKVQEEARVNGPARA